MIKVIDIRDSLDAYEPECASAVPTWGGNVDDNVREDSVVGGDAGGTSSIAVDGAIHEIEGGEDTEELEDAVEGGADDPKPAGFGLFSRKSAPENDDEAEVVAAQNPAFALAEDFTESTAFKALQVMLISRSGSPVSNILMDILTTLRDVKDVLAAGKHATLPSKDANVNNAPRQPYLGKNNNNNNNNRWQAEPRQQQQNPPAANDNNRGNNNQGAPANPVANDNDRRNNNNNQERQQPVVDDDVRERQGDDNGNQGARVANDGEFAAPPRPQKENDEPALPGFDDDDLESLTLSTDSDTDLD